jgi:type IV pilus assembly protein PilB
MRLPRGRQKGTEQRPEVPLPVGAPDPQPGDSAVPQPRPGGPKLGELLLGSQALTPGQLAEALTRQSQTGKRLGALLLEAGLVSERDITAALAEQYQLPVVDLRTVVPDPEVTPLLSESLARGLCAIPLALESDGAVRVAIGEPVASVIEELRVGLGRPVRPVLAVAAEIRRAIDQSYRALKGVEEQIQAYTVSRGPRAPETASTTDLFTDDAPVVQVVNMLITQGMRDRASDIHIEPQGERVQVRYRIDGALHEVVTLPEAMGPAIVSRIKVMGGMNIVERRRPQDGKITLDADGKALDIRVSSLGTVWGEKIVLRLLDKSKPMYRLRELGMPAHTYEMYSQLVRSPFGMVLCAGPTGSGKTTTLYASMTEINSPERNIMTIEDPVEYIFPSMNQIQINEQAGITFAAGLRSILRQDPDAILVGEIRDAETAQIAVQSALTGHFVVSSVHATDAVSALNRFLDMGVESFLLASTLLGVVSQRLLRKICDYCKVPYIPTTEETAFYEQIGGAPKEKFWAGEGCNFCADTGYAERVGVYELLRLTDELRELIVRKDASQQDIRRLAVEQGMRPLRQEAARLIEEELTTIAEVVRSIYLL